MSVKAIIARIKVRPHPKADRLAIGNVLGNQVIVGIDTPDNTLGVFIPTDSALSHEMAYHNNLYCEGKGTNKDPNKFGYLEENRRIRCITLRGAKSEGIWMSLDNLAWTGIDLSTLKEGDMFNVLGGQPICDKYISRATQRALAQAKPSKNIDYPMFKKHKDTEQLAYFINSIPVGAPIVVTRKLHGTSGRTGRVLAPVPLSKFQESVNRMLARFGMRPFFVPKQEWRIVTGSRNVTIDPMMNPNLTHTEDRPWKVKVGETFALHKNETLYYEIVGYMGDQPIMSRHSLDKDKDEIRKSLTKLYDKTITYSYGCEPGDYKVFIYRITMTNEDGISVDLSWEQVKARCEELGVQHVPEVKSFILLNKEELLSYCEQQSEGPDPLDPRHPCEGVCVRVEHKDMYARIFKYKGFVFKYLEGIAKQSEIPDLEEAS